MSNTPNRPVITPEQIVEAIKEHIKSFDAPFSAEEFADSYEVNSDSYELAKKIEKDHCCDIYRDDLNCIEELIGYVEDAQTKLEKQWFEVYKIQPPFPIGTETTKGKISGISSYRVAWYEIEIPGRPNEKRLVRFEDAVLSNKSEGGAA